MDYVTIGKRHGSNTWFLIAGPDVTRAVHRKFWKRARSSRKHRTYSEIWLCGPNGILKKKFDRKEGQDWDSSSSNSSSSSSSSTSSNSSSSSVNSSSSSSSSINSSSSSSSTESSSSSS